MLEPLDEHLHGNVSPPQLVRQGRHATPHAVPRSQPCPKRINIHRDGVRHEVGHVVQHLERAVTPVARVLHCTSSRLLTPTRHRAHRKQQRQQPATAVLPARQRLSLSLRFKQVLIIPLRLRDDRQAHIAHTTPADEVVVVEEQRVPHGRDAATVHVRHGELLSRLDVPQRAHQHPHAREDEAEVGGTTVVQGRKEGVETDPGDLLGGRANGDGVVADLVEESGEIEEVNRERLLLHHLEKLRPYSGQAVGRKAIYSGIVIEVTYITLDFYHVRGRKRLQNEGEELLISVRMRMYRRVHVIEANERLTCLLHVLIVELVQVNNVETVILPHHSLFVYHGCVAFPRIYPHMAVFEDFIRFLEQNQLSAAILYVTRKGGDDAGFFQMGAKGLVVLPLHEAARPDQTNHGPGTHGCSTWQRDNSSRPSSFRSGSSRNRRIRCFRRAGSKRMEDMTQGSRLFVKEP